MSHKSPYQVVQDEVLAELGLEDDEELRTAMSTGMQRAMNMAGERPSDAMRSECRDLKRLGRDAYIENLNEVGTKLRRLGY